MFVQFTWHKIINKVTTTQGEKAGLFGQFNPPSLTHCSELTFRTGLDFHQLYFLSEPGNSEIYEHFKEMLEKLK